MIIVQEIVKYENNPSLWAGMTTMNKLVYIQFKDGMLFVGVGDNKWYIDTGEIVGSELETKEMREYTKDVLDWSLS